MRFTPQVYRFEVYYFGGDPPEAKWIAQLATQDSSQLCFRHRLQAIQLIDASGVASSAAASAW